MSSLKFELQSSFRERKKVWKLPQKSQFSTYHRLHEAWPNKITLNLFFRLREKKVSLFTRAWGSSYTIPHCMTLPRKGAQIKWALRCLQKKSLAPEVHKKKPRKKESVDNVHQKHTLLKMKWEIFLDIFLWHRWKRVEGEKERKRKKERREISKSLTQHSAVYPYKTIHACELTA